MFIDEKRNTSKVVTVPSPSGGLNAYSSLAAMSPTDAIVLNNFVPQPYGCTVRKGYQLHSSGLLASVNSLASWASVGGGILGFAWAGDKLYDVTSSGPVGAPLLTGLGTSWWQSINFANSGGTHMLSFSGVDHPIWYSNAGLQRLTPGDGIANGTIKNVDPLTWIQGTVHQRRIWAVQVDTCLGWFLPPDAVYGIAQFFDFGPVFKRGGYLVCLATWTVDSGDGANDKLVAISSMGEAAVYAGTDVTDPNAWALEGVYFIGSPVRGRRIYTNVGGDLYLLTNTGVISMATLVTSTQVNLSANNTYSQKIQFLLSELTGDLGQLDGWEIKFVPAINLLFINVPSVYADGNGQLVANQITTSWCTFSGYNAQTFAVIQDALFFGDPLGRVQLAWSGSKDGILTDGTGGTNIIARAQQAYSYLEAPAVQKQVGMYRPNFLLMRKVGSASKITYDFKEGDPGFPTGSAAKSPVALWNDAIWGLDRWSGGPFSQLEWRQSVGIGVAASLSLTVTTEAETIWVSTDYTYQSGGPL